MEKISHGLKARLHFHNSAIKDQETRGLDSTADAEDGSLITIALKHKGDVAALAKSGFHLTTEVGSLAFGSIDINRLVELAEHEQVISIDALPPPEIRLDMSIPDIRADLVRTRSGSNWTGVAGTNITVAIIDTGIDYQHHTFRKADGKTRILKIWDQTLTAGAGDKVPDNLPATHPLGSATLNYGVLYTREQIDAALATGNPLSIVRHKDINGHGTHVAGIAAGNGAQSGTDAAENTGACHKAYTFTGVAPEADIIVVRKRGLSKGDPNNLTGHWHLSDALRFLDEEARPKPTAMPPTARRLMAINMSLGSFFGPRDGTHQTSEMLDAIAAANPSGFIMVKSAGNGAADKRHIEGSIPANETIDLKFLMKADKKPQSLEVRFSSKKLSATVLQPLPLTGKTEEVTMATALSVANTLNNGGDAHIQVDEDYILVEFKPETVGSTTADNLAGEWRVRLKNNETTPVTFNGWLTDNGANAPHFTSPEAMINDKMTLDADSTGREYIVVGAYAVEGSTANKIASFSGRGPTYDTRPIEFQKPDLCAPGVAITSAAIKSEDLMKKCCCNCCLGFYVDNQGTSMSAPHVTGTVALMLQVKNDLTFSEARAKLKSGARKDTETEKNSHTGVAATTPNVEWGAGKLNVKSAVLPTPAALAASRIVVPLMAHQAPPQYHPLQTLQERFLASPKGGYLLKVGQKHFNEIRNLINANKRVATVWHRCQGPAWLRTGFTILSMPDMLIPEAIANVQLTEAVRKLTDILTRYGSPELVNDLQIYQPDLQILRGGVSVFDLAESFDLVAT
jgi:subtilisin family serine protease